MATELSAERFIAELEARRSPEELRKIQRYFKSGEGQYGAGDVFMGVRMGQVFELAKVYIDMTPGELERLLESELHEVRAGAMSIKDRPRLLRFLDAHAATMPRTMLRYASEHLEPALQQQYRARRRAAPEAG